jgi:hypothetical protein
MQQDAEIQYFVLGIEFLSIIWISFGIEEWLAIILSDKYTW